MVRSTLVPPGSLIYTGCMGGAMVPGVVIHVVDDPADSLHQHGWIHHDLVVVVQRGATPCTAIGTTLHILEQDIICRMQGAIEHQVRSACTVA